MLEERVTRLLEFLGWRKRAHLWNPTPLYRSEGGNASAILVFSSTILMRTAKFALCTNALRRLDTYSTVLEQLNRLVQYTLFVVYGTRATIP